VSARLSFPGNRSLEFGLSLVSADGRASTLDCADVERLGDKRLLCFTRSGLEADVTVEPLTDAGGYVLDYAFRAGAGVMKASRRIVLLEAVVPAVGLTRVFSNRRDIWLPTGLRTADLGPLPDGPEGDWDADNLIALFAPGGDALLAGTVFPGRHSLECSFRRGRLRICLPIETGLDDRATFSGGAVVVLWDRPLLESLEWFGHFNRVAAGRGGGRRAMVAWNSWDWFGRNVSQQRMLEALEAIQARPSLGEKIDAIALDDGWADWGDWDRPHGTFPDLAAMAGAITRAGYAPGIWYSPLRVAAGSRWARQHGQTILWGPPRGHYPTPLTPEADRWVLDYSHPRVLEKIYDDLRRLYEIGFRYFKTDFIQAPNTNFRRPDLYNRHVTPVEGVRGAMQAVRSAIGDDSYWLACGTEVLPVAGLPDASRVSDDIHPNFSTVQVCVRHCAAHFWMNGNLWVNDPDFLIVRGPDTSGTPFMDMASQLAGTPAADPTPYRRAVLNTGPPFSLAEARTWANFHICYGGAMSLSDHPAKLNETGIELLEKALAYHGPGRAGVPLDIDQRNIPSRWLRPWDDGFLLGLFNFDDSPAVIALSARDVRRLGDVESATDIWSGEGLAFDAGAFRVELAAHRSRVFLLR
jgi:hypothetical protein